MSTLQHSIRINAPIDAVWAVLGDIAAVGRYNPLVASVRVTTSAPEGLGAARRCELTPSGFAEERVIEWLPPRVLGLELVASSWPLAEMRWRTTLTEVPGGTEVAQTTTYRVKFGLVGAVMDAAVMRRQLHAAIAGVFAALKAHVETSPGGRAVAPLGATYPAAPVRPL